MSLYVDKSIEKQINNIILDIASKISNPYELIEKEDNNKIGGFHPQTLSQGLPSTILFFVELDREFPHQKWDYVAHEHFKVLGKIIEEKPIYELSLYTGLAGINFVTYTASKNRKRYNSFLEQLDKNLLERLDQFLYHAEKDHLNNNGTSALVYDLINGLAGINIYLLMTSDKPENLEMAKRINRFLISHIIKTIKINGYYVPGWYIPPKNSPYLERESFPDGNFNLGISHGITGVLAMLSLSFSKGIIVQGQKQSIKYIVDWILKLKSSDDFGVFWPGRISFEKYVKQDFSTNRQLRESWCYGNPGILRALFLANSILKDNELNKLIIKGFNAIYLRNDTLHNLRSSIFCHGKAGLLQTTIQIQNEIKSDILNNNIEKLANEIIADYDKNLPYGYTDLILYNGKNSIINKPGLLEGSVGIGLSLLSLIKKNQNTLWDKVFLLH